MGKIQELSPHVANLIAAGEVVERPASVVKELMENAIDAGATQITVEIQNGGMSFLRVTDNGCGMSQEDAKLSFRRHATSKIREKSDLDAIATLGFRGEALAAIASVSRVDLLTRTQEEGFGVSLHLEAGKLLSCEQAGCPVGTTIIVRDLFYNTPARLKFMKRDSAEGAAVFDAVQKQAVAHPGLAVRFLRDGKQELQTAGDGQLLSAIYAVFGRQTALEMVELDSKWEKNRVRGYVSKPTASRGSRSYQVFFVNGRYVKSQLLTAALEEAYRNQIMVGRFPCCVLELTLPLGSVDVNIHPAKTEIKFINEREVYDCVYYGVLTVLRKLSGRVEAKLPPREVQETLPLKQPVAVPKPAVPLYTPPMPQKTAEKPVKITPPPAPKKPEKKAEKPVEPVQMELPMPKVQDYRVIGEVFSTYFLVEQENDLYLIDKHAAHERILFEKLKARAGRIAPQELIKPVVCRLSREEASALLANKDLLADCGYIVEEFGQDSALLRGVPPDVLGAEDELEAIAQTLLEGKKLRPEALQDELFHTVACKAAIKAGYKTSQKERDALVQEVLSREDLKYCPHGRPICIKLTKNQIAHQFGRT